MVISINDKIRIVQRGLKALSWVCLVFFSQNLWAAQEAIVTSDEAIIYSDDQMSSSIGYVKKGKKVRIGDKAKNRGQVYPIMVSGKIAYIRVLDVSTEKESMDTDRFVSERFQRAAQTEYKSNYSLSFFQYASQIKLEDDDQVVSNDSVSWTGVSLKGGVLINNSWDVDFLVNYMSASVSKVTFRAVELGLGGAFKLYTGKRLGVKLTGQILAVPFANYSYADDFRVNGYGFTTGGGMSISYLLGKNWGLEASGGFYYTKLMGLDAPSPYKSIDPVFIGSRLGLGLNYQF